MRNRIPSQVKYIEESPIQQEIIFNNSQEYFAFVDKRYKECWDEKQGGFTLKYHRVILNKNGQPRKMINSPWLQTPEAQERARRKSMERAKAICDKRNALIEDAKYLLRKNGFSWKHLSITFIKKRNEA